MAKKKKYYVVWRGVEPGIYNTWNECLLQVKGYPDAKYKAFPTRKDAEDAFARGYEEVEKPVKGSKAHAEKVRSREGIILESWSVDAACSGNPGLLEYQGVHTRDSSQIFHVGPLQQGTNNTGEFLALVHALALLKRIGDDSTPIYSDSKIAIGWVKKKSAKTKLKRTSANRKLFELIERAEEWLRQNTYKNPLLKWETKQWGEIPADFGRK
jgi:ribonuclease HI